VTETQPTLGSEVGRVFSLLFRNRTEAWERIRRGLGVLRARRQFRGCTLGSRVNVLGSVRVVARGAVSVGDRVNFWEGTIPQEIVCEQGAEVTIGARTVFNYGVSMRAKAGISIGERCMFGSLVLLHDSNRDKTAPITIGNDVWVAHGVIVEPGVSIGDGSVIGAGSVVTQDVPPFSLATGNPARSQPLADDQALPSTQTKAS
jgi:acetyltransferase-like isoleucine patch superfamily enzyme